MNLLLLHDSIVSIIRIDHTLGTVLNSALWSNPHVMVAQYAQKHPVNREEITIHCQTDSGCTAVSSLEDAVYTTRGMLHALDNELDRALSEFMNE